MGLKAIVILMALLACAAAVATPCNATHAYTLPSNGNCYTRTDCLI